MYIYTDIYIDRERLVNNGPGWNVMDGHDKTEMKVETARGKTLYL